MSYAMRNAAPLAALLVAATFVLNPSYAGARERQYHAYGLSYERSTKGDNRASQPCIGGKIRIENRSKGLVNISIHYKKKTDWDKVDKTRKFLERSFRISPGRWAPENFLMTQNISIIYINRMASSGNTVGGKTIIKPKARSSRAGHCRLYWVYAPNIFASCGAVRCSKSMLLLNRDGRGSITVIEP